MTTQRSFKRLVRARMDKTGESYTAARAMLLTADGPQEVPEPVSTAHWPQEVPEPVFTVSDEVIRRRTGRGWEDWLNLLDDWGAADMAHREIARRVREEAGCDGWSAQSVTVSYERARGLRAVGEHADGFAISVSKTVAVPVESLYEAVVDESPRALWLPERQLRLRTATKPRSARFDWGDGTTRVNVGFLVKGDAKSSVALAHERLGDAGEAERMKAFWRERLAALKQALEGS